MSKTLKLSSNIGTTAHSEPLSIKMMIPIAKQILGQYLLPILIGILCVYLSSRIRSWLQSQKRKEYLAKKVAAAQHLLATKIHTCFDKLRIRKTRNFFDKYAYATTEELQKMLLTKEISREDYLIFVFQRTNLIGKRVLNAVTAELYDEALSNFRELAIARTEEYTKEKTAETVAEVPAEGDSVGGGAGVGTSWLSLGFLSSPSKEKSSEVQGGGGVADKGKETDAGAGVGADKDTVTHTGEDVASDDDSPLNSLPSKFTHDLIKKYPLFGIPVSIKDCIIQKGCDSTCGSAARASSPMKDDGLVLQLLRDAGLLPYVRSNVPQLLMMAETENALFGVTNNPWDLTRTPGGSSGGESALIASGCSPIGIGTDIGGSIRIPAHFTGIVGFKPTPRRMSSLGLTVARVGDRSGQTEIIPSVVGPMARSVTDCNLLMQILASDKVRKADSLIPPLGPWKWNLNEGAFLAPRDRPLKIAYLISDGFFEPVKAIERAVLFTASQLASAGHTVVPFKNPTTGKHVIETYLGLISADGNWYSHKRALEGEDLQETYKKLEMYTNIPNVLRSPIAGVLRLLGEHRKADMMLTQRNGGLDVRSYWERVADMKAIQRDFANVFKEEGYDALILPPLGIPAPKHGQVGDLLPAFSYSFLANLLQWPAGVVPVTTVKSTEQSYDLDALPMRQRDSVSRLTNVCMEGSEGLPVGVQVITPAYEDEICLHVMEAIEKLMKFKHKPPTLPTKDLDEVLYHI